MPNIVSHSYDGITINLNIYTGDSVGSTVTVEMSGYPYTAWTFSFQAFATNTVVAVNGITLSSVNLQSKVRKGAGVWSAIYYLDSHIPTTYPQTYLPPYYPTVTDQWVWNRTTESWYGQIGGCVSNALASMKEVHEFKEGKGSHLQYSLGWIYGNRLPTDYQGEGMIVAEALTNLQNDGTPDFSLIPQNSGYRYPDNYFYTDPIPTGITAQQMVSLNKTNLIEYSKPQRISNFSVYTDREVEVVKQRVINDGCCIYVFNLTQDIGNGMMSTSGVITQFPTQPVITGHALVILGWKKIGYVWYWICQNGWGNWYGDSGIVYMPFYIDNAYDYYLVQDGTFIPPLITPTPPTLVSRINGGLNLTWGAVSGATLYTLQYRTYDGIYTKTSTTNTISLTGLYYGTTYFVSVKATTVYGTSPYSAENPATTAPRVPIISTGTITPTSITINTGAMSGNWDYVYVERYSSSWTLLETLSTVGTTSGSSVTFSTGLVVGQTYNFRAYSTFFINGVTLRSAVNSNTLTVVFNTARPFNWNWYSTIVSGGDIGVSYLEWNDFCIKINAFRAYKLPSPSSFTFTTVTRGDTITANIVNQAITAISAMSPPTALPPSAISGTTVISASFFNGLKESLNSIL